MCTSGYTFFQLISTIRTIHKFHSFLVLYNSIISLSCPLDLINFQYYPVFLSIVFLSRNIFWSKKPIIRLLTIIWYPLSVILFFQSCSLHQNKIQNRNNQCHPWCIWNLDDLEYSRWNSHNKQERDCNDQKKNGCYLVIAILEFIFCNRF